MSELSVAGGAGAPDEVGAVAALLWALAADSLPAAIFLMDGGVTASYWYGELAPQ